MEQKLVHASVGRRKKAIARIRLFKGDGTIKINKKTIDNYFPRPTHQQWIHKPLDVVNALNQYNIHVNSHGGGKSGQAGAIQHGIARALVLADESNRLPLRKGGLLTRDPRMTERKKYGHKGARKSFQFSKR